MVDEKILKRFSSRVRGLRTKKGLTQQELAELAEVEYKYIQKIEDKNPPSIGLLKLVKFIKALGVSFSQFFNFHTIILSSMPRFPGAGSFPLPH